MDFRSDRQLEDKEMLYDPLPVSCRPKTIPEISRCRCRFDSPGNSGTVDTEPKIIEDQPHDSGALRARDQQQGRVHHLKKENSCGFE